jgi:selenocysteine-specific elongation factor
LQDVLSKKSVIEADGIYVSRNVFEGLAAKTAKAIQDHHKAEPLSRGMLRETLREKVFAHLPTEIFKKTLQILGERGEISAEKDIVRIASYNQNLSATDKPIFDKLQKIYTDAKLEIPTLESALLDAIAGTKSTKDQARKIFQLLLDSGEIIKVTNDFYFTQVSINDLIGKLKIYAEKTPDRLIDVPSFKDLAGISRKYAIPLLEYFDQQKITRRAGDKRLIL